MPNYSTFKYGTHEYGTVGGAITRAYLFAQVVDYQRVVIQVEVPANVGDGYALVRGHTGAAEDPSDGLTIAAGVAMSPLFNVVDGLDEDAPVPPGIVYYTLFIFDGQGVWAKESATSAMVPRQRGTLGKMLGMLPGFYTSEDHNPISPTVEDSDLAKFLSGFALTYDELAGSIDATLPENRSRSVIRRLHDAYATGLGMPTEYTVGVAASARLRREAGYIYRNKGTLSGITAFAEALTGWSVDVIESDNLLLRQSDASSEDGGLDVRWGGPINVANYTGGPTVPPFDHEGDAPFSRLFYNEVIFGDGVTSTDLLLPSDNDPYNIITGAIPVTAQPYRISLWAYGYASGIGLSLGMEWYDQFGEFVDNIDFASETLTTSYEEYTAWDNPPAGAAFLRVKIALDSPTQDYVGIDMISVTAGEDPVPYRDPRSVTIVCRPDRINLAYDPGFDSATEIWVSEAGAFEYSTDNAMYGGKSGRALGTTDWVFSTAAPISVPAGGPYRYSVSAYAYAPDGGTAQIEAHFFDIDDLPCGTKVVEFPGDLSLGWVRGAGTFDSPADAVTVAVKFSGTDGPVFIDSVCFERSDRPQVFFSGTTGDLLAQDTLWANGYPQSESLLYANRLVKMGRLLKTLPYYLPAGVTARVILLDSPDPLAQSRLLAG